MTAKFEDILKEIDSGPWTWIIFVLCSVWGLFGAMQAMGAVFLGAPTDHWCHIPDLAGVNWTQQQIMNVSIPWDSETSSFSSCHSYNRTYADFLGRSFEDVMEGLDDSSPVVPCRSWDYDTSMFQSTIISEWDLVCGKEYMRSFVQSSFMAGVFLGSPVNGMLADRFGRKRVLSVALGVFLAVSVLTAVSVWFPVFLLCRFLMAITGHCVYQASYIIAIETCSIRHRGNVGILFSVPFALGYMCLAGLAWLIRDWRYLHLAISMPVVLLIANTIILPESPRWLILQGRSRAAAEEIQKAARWNRQKPLDSNWLAATIAEIHANSHKVSPSSENTGKSDKDCLEAPEPTSVWANFRALVSTKVMLKMTAVLSATWLTCTMVYYGLSMNSDNLSADPFIYMAIGGLVELPCYLLGAPLVRLVGRRITVVVTLVITGLAVMGPVGASDESKTTWWFLSITMIGKMAITLAFQVLYLYTSELYPTCIRIQGLGITSMIGRMGAILSPFVIDNLGAVHWAIPSMIFGGSSIVAAGLTCFLPETMNCDLPDTLQEMQNWTKGCKSSKAALEATDVPGHRVPNEEESTSQLNLVLESDHSSANNDATNGKDVTDVKDVLLPTKTGVTETSSNGGSSSLRI